MVIGFECRVISYHFWLTGEGPMTAYFGIITLITQHITGNSINADVNSIELDLL